MYEVVDGSLRSVLDSLGIGPALIDTIQVFTDYNIRMRAYNVSVRIPFMCMAWDVAFSYDAIEGMIERRSHTTPVADHVNSIVSEVRDFLQDPHMYLIKMFEASDEVMPAKKETPKKEKQEEPQIRMIRE